MGENHKIYIQVYEKAIDSKAKTKAIMKRRQALILSGQQQQAAMMQGMQQGENGASQNQLVSNYISQNNKEQAQPQAL
jgi:hypothetical protein